VCANRSHCAVLEHAIRVPDREEQRRVGAPHESCDSCGAIPPPPPPPFLISSLPCRSARDRSGTNSSQRAAGRMSGAGEASTSLLQVASLPLLPARVVDYSPSGGSLGGGNRGSDSRSGSGSFGSLSEWSRVKKLEACQVLSPPSIQEYQHQLIARLNTNTSSDIFEMDMRELGRKMGHMSSVWEVSQATSRTMSDGTPSPPLLLL
jgi:hypothetical protein